jgi:hypothetical protein
VTPPIVEKSPPELQREIRTPARQESQRVILAWSGLLVGVAIIGVLMMPAGVWVGDPTCWREETRSILHGFKLAIDPKVTSDFNGGNEPGQYFVQNPRNGLWYSKYGIVNSLMSLPPMLVQRIIFADTAAYRAAPNVVIYNVWNIVLSVLLAAVLMKMSGFYTTRPGVRLAFVLCALYSTFLWFYLRAQSSEVYQTLFYSAAFLFLVVFLRTVPIDPTAAEKSGSNTRSLDLMWIFIGLLVLTRVLYLLLIPGAVIIVACAVGRVPHLTRRGLVTRLLPHVLIPPVLILAALGSINFVKFGSPFLSGYHQWKPELHLPTGPMADGLRGLLIRPRFSMLLYFPLLPLGCLAGWTFIRRFPIEALAAWGGLVAFVLALAKIPTWAGEWTYGPRYILFALPVASVPFITLLEDWLDRLRNWRLAAVPVLGSVAAILLLSAYFQFRANELDFFAYYYIRPPQESDTIARYFENRPVGMILDDLQRHKSDLDSLAWFGDVKMMSAATDVERYRQNVQQVLSRRNMYWFTE